MHRLTAWVLAGIFAVWFGQNISDMFTNLAHRVEAATDLIDFPR